MSKSAGSSLRTAAAKSGVFNSGYQLRMKINQIGMMGGGKGKAKCRSVLKTISRF